MHVKVTPLVIKGCRVGATHSPSIVTISKRGRASGMPWQDGRMRPLLTREQIEEAFSELDRELGRAGQRATIHVVGGAVMCLVFRARESTKDVDAWFDDSRSVRAAAAKVANLLNLPENWLNDAANVYIPEQARFEEWRSLSNLEILVADASTLFAMKCAAARTEEDAADIRVLARELGVHSSKEALRVVEAFYPASRLPVRTQPATGGDAR